MLSGSTACGPHLRALAFAISVCKEYLKRIQGCLATIWEMLTPGRASASLTTFWAMTCRHSCSYAVEMCSRQVPCRCWQCSVGQSTVAVELTGKTPPHNLPGRTHAADCSGYLCV